MTKQDFIAWLESELTDRDWKQADLARKSGLSTGYLSKLFSRERPRPGVDACRAIARALGLPDIEVLRVAGLADPEPPSDSPVVVELIREFAQLSDDDQEAILKQVKALNVAKRLLGRSEAGS
jgi:transcriptional regulator with XRE-family HTH domain